MEHRTPGDIERTSMEILTRELMARGAVLIPGTENVVRRVIHATADFDYAENLRFTEGAVEKAIEALRRGTDIVTDTNMTLAGISKPALERLGCRALCFMAEPEIAARARARGTTRAAAAMDQAAAVCPGAVLSVGNAPTALLRIAELIGEGLRPALVIGVPVGFVNVVESKERVLDVCRKAGVPAIVALGRKGGSTVSAAILNALCYEAVDMTDPARRGWD